MKEKEHTRHIPELTSTWQRPGLHVQPVAALHPSVVKQLCPFDVFPVAEEITILHDKNAIILFETIKPRAKHAYSKNLHRMCGSGLSVRQAIDRSTLSTHRSICLSIHYYPRDS